ncbi:beta-glucanase [Streptacidiphilus sp. ASG 303]|uniref:beta-glucanase n=1 Tax=Streptacidiphilus sp. ASG 303 TaxID=2896847 RepID=UPI001E626EE3|nr:beta-glucanase [Streptacidiphilus sp. ASG 303]MCD0485164.1 beta-glucanase [Streptacidiphilus sp. ASG 303]
MHAGSTGGRDGGGGNGGGAAAARTLFTADFNDRGQWVAGRTWAYPDQGAGGNLGDHKLDRLRTSWPRRGGLFEAVRRADGTGWDTDLLTTAGASRPFRLRPGHVLRVRFQLPEQRGAWPAVWTWGVDDGPQGEVDVFEYHPDRPSVLELSNHRGEGSSHYHEDAAVVRPGRWIDVETSFGEESVVWRVGGRQVFSDGVGVGPDWRAWLIVNLSVYAPSPPAPRPQYHDGPAPGVGRMDWLVHSLTVHG